MIEIKIHHAYLHDIVYNKLGIYFEHIIFTYLTQLRKINDSTYIFTSLYDIHALVWYIYYILWYGRSSMLWYGLP